MPKRDEQLAELNDFFSRDLSSDPNHPRYKLICFIRSRMRLYRPKSISIEDAVAELYAEAVKSINNGSGFNGQLLPWLKGICHKRFLTLKDKERKESDTEEKLERQKNSSYSREKSHFHRQCAEDLHLALISLDESDREILILYYFNNYSWREVAQFISGKYGKQVTESAMRKRGSRAILALKRAFFQEV